MVIAYNIGGGQSSSLVQDAISILMPGIASPKIFFNSLLLEVHPKGYTFFIV
jgi:hypothetical protein